MIHSNYISETEIIDEIHESSSIRSYSTVDVNVDENLTELDEANTSQININMITPVAKVRNTSSQLKEIFTERPQRIRISRRLQTDETSSIVTFEVKNEDQTMKRLNSIDIKSENNLEAIIKVVTNKISRIRDNENILIISPHL